MNLQVILDTIRALSFGGIVMGGIGALIYYRFPHRFGDISAKWFIGGFAAVGITIQRVIEVVLAFIFKPIFGFLAFHRNLWRLRRWRNKGLITPERYQKLVDKLVEKRILGK